MADNKHIAEAAAAAARDAAKKRDEKLKDERKRLADEAKEAAERQNTQPTPTQEENDRAKLGIHSLEELDDKEADGSPEEKAPAPYQTRDAAAKK